MDPEELAALRARQNSLIIALERRIEEVVPAIDEEAVLGHKVEDLQGTLEKLQERHWDSGAIKAANDLRRAKGDLRAAEEAHEQGLVRLPWRT